MGEATNGVSAPNEQVSAEELEQRVALIRAHMTDVVSELDYRRHELLDVRVQLKKHGGLLAAVGGGVLLLVGATVGVSLWRARKRRAELERGWPRPRVVREHETVVHKLISAAAGALATVAVKAVATRLLRPALPAGEAPPPALPGID
jgi:hypothetical protein